MTSKRLPWQNDFPDTIINRPLGNATKHSRYQSAKSGDIEAAYHLANDLITDKAALQLIAKHQQLKVIFVPVYADESFGDNKTPLTTAYILGQKLSIGVWTDIVQSTKVSRTGKDGWYRLASPPEFDGNVPTDKAVIMIDDTQTQGGTFASLRGYIHANGGVVIGAYALTGKQYSVQLRLSKETLTLLKNDYGEIENWWKQTFGYGFDCLTEWEARYLINSRYSPEQVKNQVVTARS